MQTKSPPVSLIMIRQTGRLSPSLSLSLSLSLSGVSCAGFVLETVSDTFYECGTTASRRFKCGYRWGQLLFTRTFLGGSADLFAVGVELVLKLRQFMVKIDEAGLRGLEHEGRIREPILCLVPTRVLLVVTCVHAHRVLQQVCVVVLTTDVTKFTFE